MKEDGGAMFARPGSARVEDPRGTRERQFRHGESRDTTGFPGHSSAIHRWLAFGVAALTIWAYRNSFDGPFIWDGLHVIVENPRIRSLALSCLADTARPLAQLSFALNYAVGGLAVSGYHAVNLGIHVTAALALFVVTSRTLAGARLAARFGTPSPWPGSRFGSLAPWLAGAIAGLWAVHPLQTESVTYLVQRWESLAGLFFLLLFYAFIRAAASARPLGWQIAAVACLILGVATKATVVTAPILLLLYDRCFLAGSLRAALGRRGWFHAVMLAGTGVLPLLLALGGREWQTSTGFGLHFVTPGGYALTQLSVVAHYLRLSVWPVPLILDYAWPQARGFADVLPGALVIVPLLVLTALGIARNHPLGFLGGWFFAILAPTSGLIPIQDIAFEHRMYLSLAAVAALAVTALAATIPRASEGSRATRTTGATRTARATLTGPATQTARGTQRARGTLIVAGTLVLAAMFALAHATTRRNADYRSAIAIWDATVRDNPRNPRAHVFLGQALADAGRHDQAIAELTTAVRLNPEFGLALGGLTRELELAGRIPPAQAARDYARALELNPALHWTRVYLGFTLIGLGRAAEAATQFAAALRLNPDLAMAHYGWGVALAMEGRLDQAKAEIDRALESYPDDVLFRRAKAWMDSLQTRGAPGAR